MYSPPSREPTPFGALRVLAPFRAPLRLTLEAQLRTTLQDLGFPTARAIQLAWDAAECRSTFPRFGQAYFTLVHRIWARNVDELPETKRSNLTPSRPSQVPPRPNTPPSATTSPTPSVSSGLTTGELIGLLQIARATLRSHALDTTIVEDLIGMLKGLRPTVQGDFFWQSVGRVADTLDSVLDDGSEAAAVREAARRLMGIPAPAPGPSNGVPADLFRALDGLGLLLASRGRNVLAAAVKDAVTLLGLKPLPLASDDLLDRLGYVLTALRTEVAGATDKDVAAVREAVAILSDPRRAAPQPRQDERDKLIARLRAATLLPLPGHEIDQGSVRLLVDYLERADKGSGVVVSSGTLDHLQQLAKRLCLGGHAQVCADVLAGRELLRGDRPAPATEEDVDRFVATVEAGPDFRRERMERIATLGGQEQVILVPASVDFNGTRYVPEAQLRAELGASPLTQCRIVLTNGQCVDFRVVSEDADKVRAAFEALPPDPTDPHPDDDLPQFRPDDGFEEVDTADPPLCECAPGACEAPGQEGQPVRRCRVWPSAPPPSTDPAPAQDQPENVTLSRLCSYLREDAIRVPAREAEALTAAADALAVAVQGLANILAGARGAGDLYGGSQVAVDAGRTLDALAVLEADMVRKS